MTLAAAALALHAAAVSAHGDDKHAPPRGYDAAQVEETAFGHEGDPAKVRRVIPLGMSDAMRFTPADITVQRGETVKFVVRNDGRLLHEMVLGTPADLKAHAALMQKFPEMEHASANMAHVKPGASGEIVWQFTKAGDFQFACLQPGHFEAGMLGRVLVAGDPSAMTQGEVRRIDKGQGKLTLRHGPIANLDMPGMTMVFKVSDPRMLENIREGDTVRFSAERVNGTITVTAIEAAASSAR
jgi:uncharacterized cupredoxin-like copper-binding protein/Cu/Ag efflux protein CusF